MWRKVEVLLYTLLCSLKTLDFFRIRKNVFEHSTSNMFLKLAFFSENWILNTLANTTSWSNGFEYIRKAQISWKFESKYSRKSTISWIFKLECLNSNKNHPNKWVNYNVKINWQKGLCWTFKWHLSDAWIVVGSKKHSKIRAISNNRKFGGFEPIMHIRKAWFSEHLNTFEKHDLSIIRIRMLKFGSNMRVENILEEIILTYIAVLSKNMLWE